MSRGQIIVLVKKEDETRVSGAKVDVLRNGFVIATGLTDSEGMITFTDIADGAYSVKVGTQTQPGFMTNGEDCYHTFIMPVT